MENPVNSKIKMEKGGENVISMFYEHLNKKIF